MTLLIGKPAIDFITPAVLEDGSVDFEFNLNNFRVGTTCVLFFYAMNHDPVCSSELIQLSKRLPEFHKRGALVVAINKESFRSHQAFRKELVANKQLDNLDIPLLSDMTGNITREYQVSADGSMPLRATFIIDKNGFVRMQQIYDYALGRNIPELLRVIDALHHTEQTGELCPANFRPASKHAA